MTTNLGLSIRTLTLSAEMAAKPGQKTVRALATLNMAKELEGQAAVATRFVFVLDHSTSTGDNIPGETRESIMNVLKTSCSGIVDLMTENDEVVVIQFNSVCDEEDDVLLKPAKCDNEGKARARMAISEIFSSGGTNFAAALEQAEKFLPRGYNKNLVLIFASDGEDGGIRQTALDFCNQFRQQGVTIYTICVNTGGVGNSGEQHLSAMAGDKYFASAKTSAEVVKFFKTALKGAQRAAITNAVLEFHPIKSVTAIEHLELVEKNGVDVYLAGTITKTDRPIGSIAIDSIGPGDQLDVHIAFAVDLPDFPAGFTKQTRSFGSVVLTGGSKSMGVADSELTRANMEVVFSATPAQAQNKRVQRVIGIADGKRAQFQVQQETDSTKQKEILREASKRVQGTMALTGDDPTLQAVLAGLGDLENTSGGADEIAKKARTGTQILRADDADAALAGL